jgi:hypothetical protein
MHRSLNACSEFLELAMLPIAAGSEDGEREKEGLASTTSSCDSGMW